jgi:hypothetical protein
MDNLSSAPDPSQPSLSATPGQSATATSTAAPVEPGTTVSAPAAKPVQEEKFQDVSLDVKAGDTNPFSPAKLLEEAREAAALTKPGLPETALGVFALVAWTCFFAAGVLVSTKTYRDQLWGPTPLDVGQWFRAMFVTFCSYTVTNLLFLACLSSYLGCMAMRWHVSQKSPEQSQFYSHVYPSRLYISAVLRGFLLYLLIISGVLVISSEDAMQNTAPIQYVKIAGLVSAFGFIVGFDPQMVYRFVEKVGTLTGGSGPDAEGGKK